MFADSHEEWHGIDLHNVNTQSDVTIVLHDLWRNVGVVDLDLARLPPGGLPHEITLFTLTPYELGTADIPSCNRTIRDEVLLDIPVEILVPWPTNNNLQSLGFLRPVHILRRKQF